MTTLQDFLNANPIDNLTREVPISERFKDAEGNLMKFTIKAMTNNEFEDLRKRAITSKKGGKLEFNTKEFNLSVVVNFTLNPNFKDAKSIQALSCTTPAQYVNKVLLAGEVEELAEQIRKFSGFDAEMEEMVEEAKN